MKVLLDLGNLWIGPVYFGGLLGQTYSTICCFWNSTYSTAQNRNFMYPRMVL